MKNMIKRLIYKITPKKVVAFYQRNDKKQIPESDKYASISYAQEGEDVLLERFIGDKKEGFYIDIGAHHPHRFSNTFHFYKKGWKGLNIDAMPGSMEAFKAKRPRDINLEMGVSSEEGELLYYIFNEPALNTFSEEEAKKKDGFRNFKVIETKKIKTLPLAKILNEHLPENTEIDFMSIDVEGLDFMVIQSNDCHQYRPKYILIEDLQRRPIAQVIQDSTLYEYLNELDYSLVAKTFNTLFFKDTTS